MRRITLFLTSLFCVFALALAQNKTVRGVVISAEDNEPLPGVNLVVKGQETIGGATNLDGKFSFSVPASAKVLKVSSIGFKTIEVPITSGEMRIVLHSDDDVLDEVVVVAYGTATKNSFTGSATSVSIGQVQNKAVANVTAALEGIVPGVQVFTTTGQPGASATIQIRGIGSVNSDTSPLYVVDGIPYGLSMSGIDPSDIESMSVLKDASATALYGSRAANGVVLIKTRGGKSGKMNIEGTVNAGVNLRLLPLYETITSPEAYMEMSYLSMYNRYNRFGLKEALQKEVAKGTRPSLPTVGQLLFSGESVSIPERYNLWNLASDQLIDPATGKFNPNATRRYALDSWEDAIFRTGQRYEGNVKVSGGSDKITYFTSLGMQKNVGYYIGSDFSRLNLRNNVTGNITPNLRASANLSYSRTTSNSPGQGTDFNNGFNYVNSIPGIFPVFERDAKGNILSDPKIPGGKSYDFGEVEGLNARPFGAGINPAGSVALDISRSRSHLASANLNLEYRFLNDFKLAINYGIQYQGTRGDAHTNPYYGNAKGVGRLTKTATTYVDETANQILSWGRSFGKHNVDAFVAHESTENEYEYQSTAANMTVVAGSTDLSHYVISVPGTSYRLGYAIESYFGQARYDYDGKYFFSASVRRDGSSRFAKENRWGTFGSVGFAWLMTKEKFLSGVKWLNNLKFKASYGVLGNQELALGYSSSTPNYYMYHDLYELGNLNDLPTFSFYAKGNPDISWERSATFNTGFESKMFDNRLKLDIEFFYKTTTSMMFRKQMAPSVGYAYLPGNEGKIANYGLEADLSYLAINSKNVQLNLRANAGFYRNRMQTMAIDNATGRPKHYELQGAFAYQKGRSIQDFYIPTWAGVDSKTGLPQWEYYYTESKDDAGVVTKTAVKDYENWISTEGNDPSTLKKGITNNYADATKTFVNKSAIPDLVGGFGFDFTVHGVTLSSSFSFGLGGYAIDGAYASLMNASGSLGSSAFHVDMLKTWRAEGDVTDVPVLAANASALSYANSTSTRFLTSRSYLNLSNLKLSYELPKSVTSRLGLGSASVYVSGDNLFIVSARKGFVSMSSSTGSSSSYRYLPVSTITAGLQVRL